MTAIEAIRDQLLASAAVSALVAGKIYASKAPQGTPGPYVVCRVISDVPESTFENDTTETLGNVRLQVDCFATQYLDAKALASAVNLVLSALSSPGLSAWRVGGRDLWDSEAQLHTASADFSVWRPG